MAKMKTMSPLAAIRTYFSEGEHSSKVDVKELKALSAKDRDELAVLAAKELDVKLVKKK